MTGKYIADKKTDIQFLLEMQERLYKAKTDKTEYEYLEKMISDWLEDLQTKEEIKQQKKKKC